MKKFYLLLAAIFFSGSMAFALDGDSCAAPIAVDFSADLPYSDMGQTTCARGDNYDATCLGSYDGGEDIIYEFTVASTMEVQITFDPNGTTWTGVALFDDCPDVGTCLDFVTGSSGSNEKVITIVLDAGTYYYMADTYPTPDCISDFNLTITEILCSDLSSLGTTSVGETEIAFNWEGDGNTSWDYAVDVTGFDIDMATPTNTTDTFATAMSLTSNEFYDIYVRVNCGGDAGAWSMITVKTLGVGDNCDLPIMIDFSTLSYADSNQTTCGRVDDYDQTCMGSYDGGEDIIYELVLDGPMDIELILDPDGTTWYGVGIFDGCPDSDNCEATQTQSGSSISTINVQLTAGTYYIMVDTWPSPDCIPNFHLTINGEEVNCTSVTGLEAVDVSCTGGTAVWNSDGNTEWNVYWGAEPFDIDTATFTTITDTFLVATGEPGIDYSFYVQTNCGAAVSDWVSFTGQNPPCNDLICDADDIVVDGDTVTVDNTWATWGGDSASCWGNYNNGDVWLTFDFTPAAGADAVLINTIAGGSDDSHIALYSATGCPDGPVVLTELGCSEDEGDVYMSYIAPVQLSAGTYYIQCAAWTGAEGDYQVYVQSTSFVDPPENDECDGATITEIEVGTSQMITGNTDGATISAGFGNPQVWEAFTLTECADVTLDYCGSMPQASAIYGSLYDCPVTAALAAGTITLIECDGDSALSVVWLGLEAGTYYYPVVADTANFGGFVDYTLNISSISCDPPPAVEGESFEGEMFVPMCWTSIDADGDGEDWFLYDFAGTAYAGLNSAASASWTGATGALTPDNYLVTPQLILGDDEVLTYHIGAQDPAYPDENYGVYISTTGNEEADFTTELFTETLVDGEWYERSVDLSDYNGMTVYLAFRHYDVSDEFYLKLDNVILPGTEIDCTIGVAEVEELEFSIFPNPNNGQFTIVNEGIAGEFVVEIMDVTGKIVHSEQVQMNGNDRTEINPTNLNTGVYLVKMINTEENYYRTVRMVIK